MKFHDRDMVAALIAAAKRVGEEADSDVNTTMSRNDYVDEHLPMVSMSFAQMPPKALFIAHVEAFLDNDTYDIEHRSVFKDPEDHPFVEGGEFTAEELYEHMLSAIKMFEDGKSNMDDEHSAISWASSVMYTLRFEWI